MKEGESVRERVKGDKKEKWVVLLLQLQSKTASVALSVCNGAAPRGRFQRFFFLPSLLRHSTLFPDLADPPSSVCAAASTSFSPWIQEILAIEQRRIKTTARTLLALPH